MFVKNLLDLDLFRDLDDKSAALIIPLLEVCHFPEHFKVFEQDTNASHFFILMEGEVVVKYKPYDGEELTIAHISPQDVFGWSAALRRPRYTSSAYTEYPSTAVRVEIAQFKKFCENNKKLGVIVLGRISSGLANSLRSTREEVFSLLTRGMEIVPEK